MLFITINNKKLKIIKYIIFIIILLAITIIIIKLLYKAEPAINQEDIEYAHYYDEQMKIEFEYPKGWELDKNNVSGDEILFHIGFHPQDNKAHGFIQLWERIDYDKLTLFIQEHYIQSKLTIIDSKRIELNNIEGYLYTYIKDSNKVKDAFLLDGVRIYRVFLASDQDIWDIKYDIIFEHILNSLLIK